MHYVIIIAIIIVIVCFQVKVFLNSKKKIKIFQTIFSEKENAYHLQKDELINKIQKANTKNLKKMLDESGLDSNNASYYHYKMRTNPETGEEEKSADFQNDIACKDLIAKLVPTRVGIISDYQNSIFNVIISSINDYLINNKTVSDFHLMKDIVDRNCDAKEDEISTQIPVPLYLGLVGTMSGILIGILYLWLSGGISDLLSAGRGTGASGVEALLGGVAMAMISSICGIILTTIGSNNFKDAKTVEESNKHVFLSWIQVHLLPTLSDNVVGAIREMGTNLDNFNHEFAQHTGDLGSALENVNESYKMQVQLLDSVRKLADKNVSQQNLNLYNALKNSTSEIGTLSEYLQNCNQYLANVKALNEKLDLQEARTREIEEMGAFFKTELGEIESRKQALAETIGKVDDYMYVALQKLRENTDRSFNELQISSAKQQDALLHKTKELDQIVTELTKLGEVKKAIIGFENAINGQNAKIDHLSEHIEKLANAKISGNTVQIHQKTPYWKIALFVLIALSCLLMTINSFINSTPQNTAVEKLSSSPTAPTSPTSVAYPTQNPKHMQSKVEKNHSQNNLNSIHSSTHPAQNINNKQ